MPRSKKNALERSSVRQPLVVTPAPHPLESPMGYLSRLAESNGLRVDALVERAMLRSEYVPTLGWDYSRIGPILGQRRLAANYGYRLSNGAKGACKLGEHRVASHHVDVVKARVCPECLRDRRYVPIAWDLRAYVACHVHARYMLKSCPGCRARIRARRSRLNVCRCGYDFCSAPRETAPKELVAISELLWAKVTGEREVVSSSADLKMPVEHLLAMDLDLLCRLLVCFAGVMATIAFGSRVRGSALRVVPHFPEIGRTLSNWPVNFHAFCRTWAKRQRPSSRRGERFQWAFYWLCYRLYKNAGVRKNQYFFMVREALVYGRTEWFERPVVVKERLLARSLPPQRYITTAEAAKTLGIPSYGAIRWFKKGRLSHAVVRRTRNGRLVVDNEVLRKVKLSRHPIPAARSAAREIGLPLKLFKELRRSGFIKTEHLTTVEGSLSVEDVSRFEMDVCKNAVCERNNSHRFALIAYLRSIRPSLEEKVDTIRLIRDGGISVSYYGKCSIRSLYMGVDLLAAARKRWSDRRVPSLLYHSQHQYRLGFREARAVLQWLRLDPKARVCEKSKAKMSSFFSMYFSATAFARERGVPVLSLTKYFSKKDVLTIRFQDPEKALPYVAKLIKVCEKARAERWCGKFRRELSKELPRSG